MAYGRLLRISYGVSLFVWSSFQLIFLSHLIFHITSIDSGTIILYGPLRPTSPFPSFFVKFERPQPRSPPWFVCVGVWHLLFHNKSARSHTSALPGASPSVTVSSVDSSTSQWAHMPQNSKFGILSQNSPILKPFCMLLHKNSRDFFSFDFGDFFGDFQMAS